jgi:hypothetical protein
MDQAAWDVAREMGVSENKVAKRPETRTDGLDNETAPLFTDIVVRFCHAGN